MEKIIEIKDLSFEYKEDVKTIDNISFSIEKGTYTTILGHNGSGKSTIAKLLMGLLEKKSGHIIVGGIELTEETLSEVRSQIGIVFQNPDNQFIGATVRDDIAFGLENTCVEPSLMDGIIEEYAKKVNMYEFLDHEPTKLSGGQKQRVAIASVLALDPEVIIFDEITSMLDPKGKNKVLQIIQDIRSTKQKTLISITHDMDEAILADKCLVFSGGKLIAAGKPIEILNNKEIIDIAKIDSPFVYKLSSLIKGVEPTYNEEELIKEICK